MSRKGANKRRFEVAERFRWPAENQDEWGWCWPRQCVEVGMSRLIENGVTSPWSIHINGIKDYALHRTDLTEDEARAILRSLPNPLPRAWLEERGFVHW